MATAIIPADGAADSDETIEIELGNPWAAGLLAWALPGLGHIYQGRTGKGILFFVCILGTFLYGLYLGEGHVVYAANNSWEQQYRWQYLCQLGVGLPSAPMFVQRSRINQGKTPLFGSSMMMPPRQGPVDPQRDDSDNDARQPNELAQWIVETHPRFELGTVYTVVAGLLNVLVICDAAGGPLIIRPAPEKKPKDSKPKDREKN